MCGNYIVQAEKHTALPNQRYLWFASMDFLNFFTNYKQDHRLEITIKLNSLVWPTFEKIIDFSMHNVYWDTLYNNGCETRTMYTRGILTPYERRFCD